MTLGLLLALENANTQTDPQDSCFISIDVPLIWLPNLAKLGLQIELGFFPEQQEIFFRQRFQCHFIDVVSGQLRLVA